MFLRAFSQPRQLLIAVMIGTLLIAGTVQAEVATPERSNVLLIVVDDLRPLLGSYGSPVAVTPHIDSLAAKSYLFTEAFASVPVCGASRASLLSGLKPTRARFLTYDSRLDEDAPGAVSLPAQFRSQGYHSVGFGKVFDVSADSADRAWSEPLINPAGDWHSNVPRAARHEDLQKAYRAPVTLGARAPAWERREVPDNAYPDGALLDQFDAALPRLAALEKPLFLAVGLRKPHLPFAAPERYWALYDAYQFELPATYARSAFTTAAAALHDSPELRRQYAGVPAEGPLPSALARQLLQGYHASVSYVDALIGRLLAQLADQGLAGNTIVALLGDHGWNLGEHGLWTKHSLFDVSLRVPLLIHVPGDAGRRVHAITALTDLYPTLLELAGLPAPDSLDGASLVNVMHGTDESDRRAFARWLTGDSVRTRRHRYTRWYDDAGLPADHMLYDLRSDPLETRNLADDPDQLRTVARLGALIDAWRTQ